MNFFSEVHLKNFVDKFPRTALLICFLIALLFYGALNFSDQDFTQEEYEEAKKQYMNEMTDLDLCDSLHMASWEAMDYAEVDDENYKELLNQLNEYQFTMYVLYEFERAMAEYGVGTFLYDTDGIFGENLSTLLRRIELDEMADYCDTFFQLHQVDFQDFAIDVEQKDRESLYKQYRIKELNQKYSLDEFDLEFSALNEGDVLIKYLAEYGKANVDQFDWYAMDKHWLEGKVYL